MLTLVPNDSPLTVALVAHPFLSQISVMPGLPILVLGTFHAKIPGGFFIPPLHTHRV